MGKIVGATLCTHVPRLGLSDEERKVYLQNVNTSFYDGFSQMYQAEIKPRRKEIDTILVFSTHWLTLLDFIIDARIQHSGYYTSDEVPNMINDMSFRYLGDGSLAENIRYYAEHSGLSVSTSTNSNLPYHYSTLIPMNFLNPRSDFRVVPMSIAYTSSVGQELQYGHAIRKAIEKSDRNVVLVASGGLSHKFPAMEKVRAKASPDLKNISPENRKFDQDIIKMMKQGIHSSVLSRVDMYRERCHPEGQFAHYIRMVGALGGYRCTAQARQYGNYEAAVGTGQVILWFDSK